MLHKGDIVTIRLCNMPLLEHYCIEDVEGSLLKVRSHSGIVRVINIRSPHFVEAIVIDCPHREV